MRSSPRYRSVLHLRRNVKNARAVSLQPHVRVQAPIDTIMYLKAWNKLSHTALARAVVATPWCSLPWASRVRVWWTFANAQWRHVSWRARWRCLSVTWQILARVVVRRFVCAFVCGDVHYWVIIGLVCQCQLDFFNLMKFTADLIAEQVRYSSHAKLFWAVV